LSEGDTLTFTDAAGCGFGASAGTFNSLGADGNENTVTSSAGGTPTNRWDFNTTMNMTADYTTFEKMSGMKSTGTWDIDNCTFQNGGSGTEMIYINSGSTVSSFTNNTLQNPGSGTSWGLRSKVAHTAFDNITVTGSWNKEIWASDVKLEFANSSFDITDCDLDTSGIIISKTHNDTADLYEMAIGSTLTYSTIVNTPDIPTAVINQRTGILTFNSDNKEFDSYNVFSGATIRVTDGKDMYLNTFDNDGTWDQTAGYGGDIHVGDFTPFDSGDIIDDLDFIDTGFHDISHYLEMDL